ncbi:MAG: hypothetical protein IMZ62_01850, partial [Chloroflexi bacterium]|nr:hypothetical protein [Chloroflexota bacterium]
MKTWKTKTPGGCEWYRTDLESLSEMVAVKDMPLPADIPSHDVCASSSFGQYPEQSWDMGVGFDGAVHLATHGWPEGADRVKALAARFYDKIAPRVQRSSACRMAVDGAGVDVSAYLAGEPECMV